MFRSASGIARAVTACVVAVVLPIAPPLVQSSESTAGAAVEGDTPDMATEAPSEEGPAQSALMETARAIGGATDPLFASSSPLQLRLEGPIREIIRDRRADPEEHEAIMSWSSAEGDAGVLEIEYRARGKSRRRKEQCDFPPIRLDIPRSQADGTLFEHQDKLKLVTHCKRIGSGGRVQFEWVNKEYFAYRILNALTDYSFRVRLVDVTYVAEDGDVFEHPGFLIEDKDRLAARLGLEVSDRPTIGRDEMVPSIAQVMEIFEYMIGNTDFSFRTGPGDDRCCHNAIQLTDGERYVPVPYDFDLTGVVDKPNALPAEGLGIRKVTDRRYRGYCRDPAFLDDAVALFLERRADVDRILEQEIAISDRSKRLTRRFLDKFYDVLEDPRRLEREFVRRCRD